LWLGDASHLSASQPQPDRVLALVREMNFLAPEPVSLIEF
jgi:hypothetical protein